MYICMPWSRACDVRSNASLLADIWPNFNLFAYEYFSISLLSLSLFSFFYRILITIIIIDNFSICSFSSSAILIWEKSIVEQLTIDSLVKQNNHANEFPISIFLSICFVRIENKLNIGSFSRYSIQDKILTYRCCIFGFGKEREWRCFSMFLWNGMTQRTLEMIMMSLVYLYINVFICGWIYIYLCDGRMIF